MARTTRAPATDAHSRRARTQGRYFNGPIFVRGHGVIGSSAGPQAAAQSAFAQTVESFGETQLVNGSATAIRAVDCVDARLDEHCVTGTFPLWHERTQWTDRCRVCEPVPAG